MARGFAERRLGENLKKGLRGRGGGLKENWEGRIGKKVGRGGGGGGGGNLKRV